jgi:choloylglycine hydrolase
MHLSKALPLFILASSVAYPCTTFQIPTPEPIVAKNFDWHSGQGLVFINKRNVRKTAILVGQQAPLTWKSKYMSLTFNMAGRDFPSEGLNEAGLSVDILVLRQKAYPNGTDSLPFVSRLQWVQYILDTSATLGDAIQQAQKANILIPKSHYFVCDKASNCATFEFIGGKPVIHSGDQLKYKALANSTYSSSESYLDGLLSSEDPEKILATPSDQSPDRFSRAAVWSTGSPGNEDIVTYAFDGLGNVAQRNFTQWSFVYQAQSQTIHWKTRLSTSIKTVRLGSFNPSCASGVKVLDINASASGHVGQLFENYTPEINRQLIEQNPNSTPDVKQKLENYPETQTRCLDPLTNTQS